MGAQWEGAGGRREGLNHLRWREVRWVFISRGLRPATVGTMTSFTGCWLPHTGQRCYSDQDRTFTAK